MLKGIIFDMDGVLINSEPFHYRIWKETLRRRGIQIEYEVYKACIGSTVGFLMKLLHEHYGVSLQDTALVEEMREIKEEMMAKEGYPPLIPYVKELLEKLCGSGYQLAGYSEVFYLSGKRRICGTSQACTGCVFEGCRGDGPEPGRMLGGGGFGEWL